LIIKIMVFSKKNQLENNWKTSKITSYNLLHPSPLSSSTYPYSSTNPENKTITFHHHHHMLLFI
jgi:hypothetical protein